jgi:DNA repair protein SbcC/Rad50
LLDLGVYEEMRKRGAGHASRLAIETTSIDAQLHDLLVDPGQVAQTEARLDQLRQLSERVSKAVKIEEELTVALNERRQLRDRLQTDIGRLDSVEPPKNLAGLGEQLGLARQAEELASTRSTEAEARTAQLTTERAGLGEIAALERAIDAHRRVVDLAQRVERGAELAVDARTKFEAAKSEVAEAESSFQSAVDAQRDLENLHAAHSLRRSIVAGRPCPVCLQVVDSVPDEDPPADLAMAGETLGAAGKVRDEAVRRLNEAGAEVAKVEALVEQRREELAAAQEAVAGLPLLDEVTAARERAVALDASLATARQEAEAAHVAMTAARAELEKAANAGKEASAALDRFRDRVAGLDPPSPSRVDAAADWQAFLDWVLDARTELTRRSDDLAAEMSKLETEITDIHRSLQAETKAADVAGDDPRVAVAAAMAATETTLVRMRTDLEKKQDLEARRVSVEAQRIRYDETAKLLRSNRFQQWLIEEALVGLVEFANAELSKLAGGAYSLAVDSGDFEVIDHRNAEARRSVKTLSGGETFLVSLALALALAERVVATSAIGTARIESMFLDEGFGTLDAETLDTVAAVVQELGSRERMIGLVTHVRELADQIPTRYEVRKLPEGSTVTRVDG